VINILIFNSLLSCLVPTFINSSSSSASSHVYSNCSTSFVNSLMSSFSHPFSYIAIIVFQS
jgi:hypothetical protein